MSEELKSFRTIYEIKLIESEAVKFQLKRLKEKESMNLQQLFILGEENKNQIILGKQIDIQTRKLVDKIILDQERINGLEIQIKNFQEENLKLKLDYPQ